MLCKVRSTLTAYVTSAYYFLEGREIMLGYDGDATYTSTDLVDVQDRLDVTLRVYGLNGTDWKLAIEIKEVGGGQREKEYEAEETIQQKQTYLHIDEVELWS